ncbi:MAG: cell division protein FtsW [Lachnospiraceae bacterium]|nr:cell division protein FtsW [Lachnospiraceae bacterium]
MAGRRNRNRKKEEYFFDYTLLFIVLFLLGFGLVMLYSTSSYEAALDYGDSAYYLKKQLLSTALGIGCMIFVASRDYHVWEKFAVLGYIVAVVMILMVLSPLGHEVKGARRWLRVGPLSLQPAEIAKLAMILFLAVLVCKMGKGIRTWKGFGLAVGSAIPICLLIWQVTNNLSSAIIIGGIAVLMVFVAAPDYKRFIGLAAIVCAVAALAVFLIVNNAKAQSEAAAADGITQAEEGIQSDAGFRGDRIIAWLDPEKYASDEGFQTLQALYAIGSGNIFGKGLGRSMQKLGFLPEAQNDMIFSIICEELGLFGALSIMLLFIILIWRFMVIANNASDLFGALLVVGVLGHIAIQVILNIAVVTNTIPNTGISLPFISYGGTSILFLLSEIGLVLSVSKGIRLNDVG